MKALTILTISASLFLFIVAATAQEKTIDRRPHVRMMAMMKDSSMVNMMMDHIAKDDHMRMMMMHKMMKSVKSDNAKMMEMCKAMLEDKDTHSMMMKMMGSEVVISENERQEVLVKFKPDVKENQIKAMALEIGMQQVKVIKELNLRVFKITSQKNQKEVIEHCENEPFVEYAEPNQTYKTQK